MLSGASWRRLFPRVWVHIDHLMSDADWLSAAALALPERAQLSHVSRIQALGLNVGDQRPIHFTVSGDLHIDLPGIFLHRTELLPPLDNVGVTPAAAFIQLCATARRLDAIVAGDWLLHGRHMTRNEVSELARRDDWRPGAGQVRSVLPYLNSRSRSPKESETRALLVFAGLPVPEVNGRLEDVVDSAVIDLLYRRWMLGVEVEGRQHAFDTKQFNTDIVRYAMLRGVGLEYVQVTQEMLRQPRAVVMTVHRKLVERGYLGPAPLFAGRWNSLFEPVRATPSRHLRAVS